MGNSIAPESASRPEHLLEESRHCSLRLRVGTVFRSVLRRRESQLCAAVELELPADLGGAQLLDQNIDLGERRDRVLGAVQDQDTAIDVLCRPGREIAEAAVDR